MGHPTICYHYDIQFKSTDAHDSADGLSHLPLSQTINEDQSEEVSSKTRVFAC